MKIRINFVSNSSSSSFFIVGKELSESEIIQYLKEMKKVIFVGKNLGHSGDCGDWIIDLNVDIWNLLKNSNYFRTYSYKIKFYYVDKIIETDVDCNKKMVSVDRNKNIKMFEFNRDYSSTNDIEQIKNYIKYYD